MNVLLIEDNPVDAAAIERMLRQAAPDAFDLIRACCLQEGLEKIRSGAIHITIVDLQLPDSVGIHTLRRLVHDAPDTPLVVLTATDDLSDAIESIKAGACDYFVKGRCTGESLIRGMAYAIERKNTDRLLALQFDIAKGLADASSLKEAISRVLGGMSKWARQEFGIVWTLNADNRLHCADLWNGRAPAPVLEAICKQASFGKGEGLPGRSWQNRAMTLLPHLSKDETTDPRKPSLLQHGLNCAMAFPVLLDEDFLGVVELFGRQSHPVDDQMIKMVTSIGSQLGQFIRRKEAEESARRASRIERQTIQSILEKAPTGIVRLDTNLVIKHVNQCFATQFKLDKQLVCGNFLLDLVPGLPLGSLLEAVQKGRAFKKENFELQRIDAYWDLMGWPLYGPDRTITGMVLMTTDVSTRMLLHQERETFIATLMHDLKNPLISSRRVLGMVMDSKLGSLNPETLKVLRLLQQDNAEMLTLIDNLLEVYNYTSGAKVLVMEDLPAEAIVGEVIDELRPVAEQSGIKLLFQAGQNRVCAKADRKGLRQIIACILENAIKFTGTGGVIELVLHSGDQVILEIRNNSLDIPGEDFHKLLQPYSQSSVGQKYTVGTGLGLFLSRCIAEAHGGSIECHSQSNDSAVFTLALPAGGCIGRNCC